jgi:hypothetical protein
MDIDGDSKKKLLPVLTNKWNNETYQSFSNTIACKLETLKTFCAVKVCPKQWDDSDQSEWEIFHMLIGMP